MVITGRSLERLEAAKEEIEQYEGQILCIDMDVRDPERVQYTVDKTVETFGKIDGLVNNAAGNFLCAVEDLSYNGWHLSLILSLMGHGTVHKL